MIEEEKAIIGEDWYPYGIEKNRPTIEALLQYTHEHGLTDRRVKIEELFAPSTMRDIPLGDGPARLSACSVRRSEACTSAPRSAARRRSTARRRASSSTVSTRNCPFAGASFAGARDDATAESG